MIAQTIYNITMALMDEMKNDGTVDINSTKDYLARTPGILSILQTELIMELRKIGSDISFADEIEDMDTEMDLEDEICMGIVPYGLASRLLAQEDSALSNYFNSLYEDRKLRYLDEYKKKAVQEDREDVYNSSMRAGD